MRVVFLFLAATLTMAAENYYVTISGLGGEPDYEKQFALWSNDLDRQLRLNGPNTHLESISGTTATRQHLREVLGKVASAATPDDAFALFLIGHGSFDGSDYKFNVPGRDITATDLRDWLSPIKASRQLVVNMSSCSGASITSLAARNRLVITATKSGNEKNAPVFARFFIEALGDGQADTDKDGAVSAQEAYRYAQQKVAAYFVSEKLIASEHSTLTAQSQPGAFLLVKPQSEEAVTTADPRKQKLIRHKDELEARIDRLKYEKAGLAETDYKQQLSSLLLDLARTQAEIDK